MAKGDKGKRPVEIVGEAPGLNYKKVMRYICLNSLIPEFRGLHMVPLKTFKIFQEIVRHATMYPFIVFHVS